jgi:hypothetical protein
MVEAAEKHKEADMTLPKMILFDYGNTLACERIITELTLKKRC